MADDRLAILERRLGDRIAELIAQGPGEVRCERIHSIADVRTLRACDEVLTNDERAWLDAQRKRCEQALFGVQLSGPSRVNEDPRSTAEPDHWFTIAVAFAYHPIRTYRSLRRPAGRAGGGSEQLVEAFDRAPLPAPAPLIDAAVAWLTAGLAEGRTSHPLSGIRAPWEAAHVVTVAEWERD